MCELVKRGTKICLHPDIKGPLAQRLGPLRRNCNLHARGRHNLIPEQLQSDAFLLLFFFWIAVVVPNGFTCSAYSRHSTVTAYATVREAAFA